MRFSIIKKNKTFGKNYMKVVSQEVATCRHDASKDVEGACSRDGSYGKVNIEETDGSCSGQQEHDLPFLIYAYGFDSPFLSPKR